MLKHDLEGAGVAECFHLFFVDSGMLECMDSSDENSFGSKLYLSSSLRVL